MDWTGNTRTTYATIGASNHTEHERQEHDYYATDPIAAEKLCEIETFSPRIWEPACGEGHLSKVLEKHGFDVLSTDLINRGYGTGGVDFFECREIFDGDIITNPPYKYAKEFIQHALEVIPDGHKVAMFLKLVFLESSGRKDLWDSGQLKTLWVSRSRIPCAMNGKFVDDEGKKASSAVAYGWYIFQKGYSGTPEIKWFN